jgi:hypothetical protein
MTLAMSGFERYGKTPRRASFLTEMERVLPLANLFMVQCHLAVRRDTVEPTEQHQRTAPNCHI